MIEENWFGARLKTLRERAGLTQEQLAEQMDVSGQSVWDWENGRKRPGLGRVPRLSEVLGVEPGLLFPPLGEPAGDAAPGPDDEGLPPGGALGERLDRIERKLGWILRELRAREE